MSTLSWFPPALILPVGILLCLVSAQLLDNFFPVVLIPLLLFIDYIIRRNKSTDSTNLPKDYALFTLGLFIWELFIYIFFYIGYRNGHFLTNDSVAAGCLFASLLARLWASMLKLEKPPQLSWRAVLFLAIGTAFGAGVTFCAAHVKSPCPIYFGPAPQSTGPTPVPPPSFWVQLTTSDPTQQSKAVAFQVTPVIANIDGLKDAVKAKLPNALKDVDAVMLKVYAHDAATGGWVEVMKASTLLAPNEEETAYHVLVP